MKKTLLFLTLAALGCANASSTQTVNMNMTEMMFMPMSLTLKAGQKVTIKLSNTGKVVHEFQAYAKPQTLPKDEAGWDAYMKKNTIWLASKDTALSINGKPVKGSFFEVELKPGEKASLSFTPTKAGNFEMACHKPGHYEGGMKGPLTVK